MRRICAFAIAVCTIAFALPASADMMQPGVTAIPSLPPGQNDPRPRIVLDPAQYQRFEGYYILGPQSVFTINDIHGVMTAQLDDVRVRLYAQDPVTFYARRVGNQCPRVGIVEGELPVFPSFCAPGRAMALRFVTDADGKANELILYQDGRERRAQRADYATAAKVAVDMGHHIAEHIPSPGTAEALQHLLTSMQTGAPDYDAVTPDLAALLRAQYPAAGAAMKTWGPFKYLRFFGVTAGSADVYLAVFEHIHTLCAIMPLTADGRIGDEICRRGPADDAAAGF